MTVQFLDVIADVLVKKYGVRVIMTTHSPSTVALAPEGSIFQMERGGKEVKKVERRDDVLAVLTSGLVTVSKASKFCFVEDEDDVSFYDVVRDILTDYGPSKDPFSLRPSPSLAFIAASVGQGYQKLSGGSSIAIKWVEKLDADPLRSTFLGLIDKDRGNRSTDRIKVIGRYSFENYLLDPANIFGLLLESGKAPVVEGLSASPGDEHLLRTQSNGILQAIVDTIASLMEATEPTLKGGLNVSVTYTRGQKITLPSWVLDYRGHDLLQVAQRAFGGVKLINRPRLLNTLRRVRLIPFELAAVLAELQGIELTPEAVS